MTWTIASFTRKSGLLAAFALCGMGGLRAGPVTIEFVSQLTYDPAQTVTAGGLTAGDVIGWLFGGAAGLGTVQVPGALTYDSATAPVQTTILGEATFAHYEFPITSAQLLIGPAEVSSNVAAVNAGTGDGSFSSGLGATTACFGLTSLINSFCPPGQTSFPTNAAAVYYNTPVSVVLPDGTTVFDTNSVLAFYLGGTAAGGEFSPALNAGAAGDAVVRALFLGMIGNPGERLFGSNALPGPLPLTSTGQLASSLVQVTIGGPNFTSNILLQGSLTSVQASPVPEPATWALLAAGLAAVAWRRRTRLG